MRDYVFAALLNIGALIAASSASACPWLERLELNDVSYADVVVVGRVTNYTLVLDPEARQRRQKLLTKTTGKLHEILKNQSSFMSDYARFDLVVEEVLHGTAPATLTVTWDNSSFGEPKTIAPGPYLIALRKADSPRPPMRGGAATILPTPDPASMTVLQAPCSGPFLFESPSDHADRVRQILKTGSKQVP